MAWGISKTGFNRPNQADLKAELDQRQRELFGEDVNLSAKSPNGIINGIFSWFLAKVYEVAEKVYHSGFVAQAEGVALDYKTAEFNTFRQPEQPSEVILVIEGTPGTVILAGTRFETPYGLQYELKTDVTITALGSVQGEAVCLTPGDIGNVAEGTITVQSEPNAGVTSVSNPEAAYAGRNEETDDELRTRLLTAGASNGAATANSILSVVLGTVGVRTASIAVNNTNTTLQGRPPKSFEVYAYGGIGQDIAEAIFSKAPAGIEPFGSDSFTVEDISGNTHTVKYTPAAVIQTEANITLTTDNTFPVDGVSLVKTAIVQLIGGSDGGVIYTGLNVGDDVIYSKVLAAIMKIQGVQDATVQIRKTGGTFGTSNLSIALNEVAQINSSAITVTS